jgi:hypothetical protein
MSQAGLEPKIPRCEKAKTIRSLYLAFTVINSSLVIRCYNYFVTGSDEGDS